MSKKNGRSVAFRATGRGGAAPCAAVGRLLERQGGPDGVLGFVASHGFSGGKRWENLRKYRKIMGKLWENYGKNMGKLWENYGKTMEKIWENYGKTMGKLWNIKPKDGMLTWSF